jgi:mannose-6-phosphate isomerase-like protein (cupin superfamily)
MAPVAGSDDVRFGDAGDAGRGGSGVLDRTGTGGAMTFVSEGNVSAAVARVVDQPGLALGPLRSRVAASVDLTGGRYSLYHLDLGTGAGAGAHYHRTFAESFHVLAGTVRFYDGERWFDTGPGDHVIVPEGGIHAFRNAAEAEASMLMMSTLARAARTTSRRCSPPCPRVASSHRRSGSSCSRGTTSTTCEQERGRRRRDRAAPAASPHRCEAAEDGQAPRSTGTSTSEPYSVHDPS